MKMKTFIKWIFFFFNTKIVFTKLNKLFIIALIYCDFHTESHIRIKLYSFNYVISRIFHQFNFNNLSSQHQIIFFSQEIISLKIQYKTYNNQVLAIVKLFKTYSHYIKSNKYQVLFQQIITTYVIYSYQKLPPKIDTIDLKFIQILISN